MATSFSTPAYIYPHLRNSPDMDSMQGAKHETPYLPTGRTL